MQQQDLRTQITFVIPVRVDCRERADNLRAVLRYLGVLGCRILVLEADAAQALGDMDWPDTAEYTFVEDASPVFHRTHYINALLRMAGTDIVGVWDTDVLVGYGQICEAARRIQAGCTIAYPYNGQFVMLSEQLSASVRKSLDLEYLRNRHLKPFLGRRLCGGACLAHRRRYLECGGENERFTSRSLEDTERLHRVRILGHQVAWSAGGQLYHLYHPCGVDSINPSEEDVRRQREEFVRVCCMSPDELKSYLSE